MSTGADGQTDPILSLDPGPSRTRSDELIRSPAGWKLPDRVWVPAVGAVLLAIVFVVALLVRADGDVSVLVHAAPPDTSVDSAPGSLTVQGPDEGFDGQFFYRLGVSPWSTDDEVAGVTFDLPALRNSRWGYGALAWVSSAGDADLVPWALVGLNVVAMAAVGAIGGGLARSSGRHAAWGLLFAMWPGFAYSLSMDTSELVASAFVLGGLLAARHRRWAPAALALSAAAITRDTTIVVAAGLAAAGIWTWIRAGAMAQRRFVEPPDRGILPTVTGALPLLVFGVWQLVQQARFGELPLTSSGDNNLSAPFAGLADQILDVVPPSGSAEALRLVCIVGLVALTAAAAWTMSTYRTDSSHRGARDGPDTSDRTVRPDGSDHADRAVRSNDPPGAAGSMNPDSMTPGSTTLGEAAAWCLAFGVVVVLNAYLWSGATAFMRATTELGLLSTLVVLSSRHRHAERMALITGAGLVGLWSVNAVAQLSKLG